MKIESLELSGLRSHRGNPPTELDLTGKKLVAVIGPTGAGKSSLLEGVTFALFGEATFGAQVYDQLSTDGNTEISVRFCFSIGDDRYQLVRTVAPNKTGTFGSKVAWIRRVDEDGKTITHIESRRPVDAEIRRLLGGMDREQFCQTVLLAQNRFAVLLEAKESDRNQLLDILLGLTTLDRARKATMTTHKSANRNLERLEDRRAHLPNDPAAHVQAAQERSEAMTKLATRAEAGALTLTELSRRSTVLTNESKALEEKAALRIAGSDGRTQLEDVLRRLDGLTAEDERLTRAISDAAAGEQAARSALGNAAEELTRVEGEHGRVGSHDVVAALLLQVAALVGERPANAEALAECERQLVQVRVDDGRAKKALEDATRALEASQQAESSAGRELATAQEALSSRQRDIIAANEAVDRLKTRVGALEEDSAALSAASDELQASHRALETATAKHETDATALAAAERSSQAAAVAHGCQQGDSCPICHRDLPSEWTPPEDGDLAAFRSAEAASKAQAEDARTAHQRATVGQARALSALVFSAENVTGSHRDVVALCEGRHLPAPPMLAANDQDHLNAKGAQAFATAAPQVLADLEGWRATLGEILAPLQGAVSAAEVAVGEANKAHVEAKATEQEASDHANETSQKLVALVERQHAAQEMVAQGDRRIEELVGQIAEPWRSLVDLDDDTPINAAQLKLADDKAAVTKAAQDHKEAEALLREGEASITVLSSEKARDVDTPVAVLAGTLATLTSAVTELASAVDVAAPAEVGPDQAPAALKLAAGELQAVLEEAIAAATAKIAQLRAEAAALIEPAHTAVSELVTLKEEADPDGAQIKASPDPTSPLGESTLRAVQQLLGSAQSEAQAASDRAAQAKIDAEEAQKLDARINELGQWRSDLAGAADVLKKDNFPSWARDQRIAELVGSASELLSEMSGGRYRFDHRLSISDEINGVVRSASTLSGGEKFEAALALALGVAEIAGRSGIRFDTLFLDEGFAGLDQANLDRALDALETEVEAGRCIVLITHIGAVADRIQDVLYVEPDGLGGSKVRWLDEDERYELGADLDLADVSSRG